jgi:translocation and assembly module TamB
MTWKERLIGVPLAIVGAVLLLATGIGMALTRTDWGREEVRSLVLQKLNGAIRGRVEVDEVLEGDLLRMVRLAGVRIYEPDGREFARIDTLSVHYRWSDFLIGSVTFNKVILVGPVVSLRVSEQGGWNFAEVFRGRGSGTSARDTVRARRRGRRIVLRDVRIRSGDVTLRMPWRPKAGMDPDSSRWHLERVAGGWERVLRLERLSATLPMARVAAPGSLGRLFQVAQLSGRATIIGDPIEVEQLRADIEARRDTLSFQVWEADLPGSQLFGEGWVTLRGDPEYDLMLRGNPVSTPDLTWLIPRLPPGTARLDFRFRHYGDGFALEAQNARWESPGAKLAGRFAMTARGGGLRFDGVDLDIERLHTAQVRSLTGWEAPVAANLAGHVKLNGPLSALEVDADLEIEPETGSPPSRVVARGLVGAVREGLGAGDLELRLDTLQLDLVRAFVPGLKVRGRVSGVATLDGRLSDGLAFDFRVEQRDRGLVPTLLNGRGTIKAPSNSPLQLDVEIVGGSLSLTTLSEYYPAIPFRGDYRPNVRAVGTLDDLEVRALLKGSSDSLRLTGSLKLATAPPRYRGEAQGWRTQLPQFRPGLPASDLDFRVEFEGSGATLDELEGRARAQLFASFVGGVGFDSAAVALRVADGRLLLDSSVVAGEFGRLQMSGALPLLPDDADSLSIELRADSLGAFNPWLLPAVEVLPASGLRVNGGASATVGISRVEGSSVMRGWLVRDSRGLTLRGELSGERVSYGDLAAASFQVEKLEVGRDGGRLRAGGALSARGVKLGLFGFDSLALVGDHRDSLTAVQFQLEKEGAVVTGRGWARAGAGGRTLGLDELRLRLGGSSWDLAAPASIRIGGSGALAIEPFALRGSSREATLEASVDASGPVSLNARLVGVDLGDVTKLWPDSLGVAGVLGASVELFGEADDPAARGSFEIVDGRLFGVEFSDLGGTVEYRGGELSVDVSMRDGRKQMARLYGRFPLDLRLPRFELGLRERAIDLTLEGDSIPLTLASLITKQIAEPGGHARGRVRIGGTPGEISLEGPVTLSDGRFRVIRTGIVYERLSGELSLSGNVIRVNEVTFSSAQGGRGALKGTLTLSSLKDPEFDLELDARDLAGYDQLDARAVVSGKLELRGSYMEPTLVGKLSVVSGVLFIDQIGRRREIVDPFARPEGFTLLDSIFGLEEAGRRTPSPFLENLTMDLDLAVERDMWLRSAEANVEIAGKMTVRMRPDQEEMRIDGTLEAVRGDYRLFNKRFEVSGGTIEFVGTPGMNPNLRIVALYTVRTQKQPIEIRLVIGGTLEEMTLSLESDHQPPIPESDLLSYLLFGRPAYELTRTSEESNLLNDVTSSVPQAFLGYALSSLLVGEAGIAYVDVSRATPSGSEGEYRSGVGPALAATQVEVGWYLAPTVFVSVAQHLVGAVRPTVRLDWRLDDRFTLRGVSEPRFGREGVLFYGGPGQDLEQSIGLFLFYGWSY